MKYFIIRFSVFFALFLISVGTKAQTVTEKNQTQVVKLDELINCFLAPQYPECLYEMLEARGLYRVDKEYLQNCERVVYTLETGGKPSLFFNPMQCVKPAISNKYPVRFKNELELQFQKGGRAYFESLNALIRKQCQPLPDANDSVTGKKSTLKAYKHPAGLIFVVQDTQPVGFIYLMK